MTRNEYLERAKDIKADKERLRQQKRVLAAYEDPGNIDYNTERARSGIRHYRCLITQTINGINFNTRELQEELRRHSSLVAT